MAGFGISNVKLFGSIIKKFSQCHPYTAQKFLPALTSLENMEMWIFKYSSKSASLVSQTRLILIMQYSRIQCCVLL
jgi:hypothetical protein